MEGWAGAVAGGDGIRPLEWDSVGSILQRGGTIIGTPPNVAESDMETFLALATGFLSWSQAREDGRISTSGSHVEELAEMLPVVDAAHRCGR